MNSDDQLEGGQVKTYWVPTELECDERDELIME